MINQTIYKEIIKSLEGIEFSIGSRLENDSLESLDKNICAMLSTHLISVLNNPSQDTGHIRVINDGLDLHPATFYDARVGNGLIFHSQLRDRTLHQVLSRGGTVVIDHINDLSPIAQAIQEYVESRVQGNCWIQCYITKANKSAFNLHQDDHPFIIIQVAGQKQWKHLPGHKNRKEEIIYKPGDIAFYPRNFSHDVSGIGELSIHLTIAFDSFPVENEKSLLYSRRKGTGLPFSLGAEISKKTPSRLALRKRSWFIEGKKLIIDTGTSVINLESEYVSIIDTLYRNPVSTPEEISFQLNLELNNVIKFWELGYKHGLLFNAL